jgi:Domain of unknown function (DUF1707)
VEVPVMAGPQDLAAGGDRVRASHADREQVIGTLKAAFVQGRLAKDEFDLRIGQALASRTYGDLAAVVSEVPTEPAEARPLPKLARAHTKTPEGKVLVRGGAGGAIAIAAVIMAAGATGSDAVATLALVMLWGYILFLLIATCGAIDSRLEQRRVRKQMPPGPGRHALEAGRRGTGHDPVSPGHRTDQTRTDLRANSSRPGRPHSSGPSARAPRGVRPVPGAV